MVKHKKKLFIAYEEERVPEGGSRVYANSTALSLSYTKDAAGHVFHQFALKQAGLYDEPEESATEEDEASSMGTSRQNSTADFSTLEGEAAAGAKWRGKKKKKKREGEDLYALLGLHHERWTATPDQIRASYRKSALVFHPDKLAATVGDDEAAKAAAEEKFKRLQEAYETLSDPARRREYDSTDDFDDSLPQECAPADFFKVFGAAFQRNSRWSVNQPVPGLGDDSSPMEKVNAFYDFWYTFKSWREFPHPDEEDVEQAESREHRRWIERYNAKLREKAKREESRRIRQFVEDAFKQDPRVLRRKEEERLEKERKRAEREAVRAAQLAEEQRLREEEEARKAAAEAAAAEARKQRQVEKKALQKERARLRRLGGEAGLPSLDAETIELLCGSLGLEAMQALCEVLADGAVAAEHKQAAVQQHLGTVQAEQAEEQRAKEEASRTALEAAKAAEDKEKQQRVARLREWDEEEVRMLRKALDKFPPGTSKRWEQVQAYVRTRTLEEVLDMVKHGLKGGKYTTPQQESFMVAKKRQANTVIRSAADTRDVAFTDVNVNLRGEAVKLVNGAATAAATGAAAAGGSGSQTTGAGPAADSQQQQQQPAAAAGAAATRAGATAVAAPKVAAPKVVASPASGEWSEVQELALVKAVKQVNKDVEGDRWEQIAALVPGKTKAQCFRRFKELKDSFKAKKGRG